MIKDNQVEQVWALNEQCFYDYLNDRYYYYDDFLNDIRAISGLNVMYQNSFYAHCISKSDYLDINSKTLKLVLIIPYEWTKRRIHELRSIGFKKTLYPVLIDHIHIGLEIYDEPVLLVWQLGKIYECLLLEEGTVIKHAYVDNLNDTMAVGDDIKKILVAPESHPDFHEHYSLTEYCQKVIERLNNMEVRDVRQKLF